MILLVCGGRGFNDWAKFCDAMRGLPVAPTLIIEGDARGADRLAKTWASLEGVHCATVPPLWKQNGNAAGGDRNAAMLTLRPDYCLAMPGGSGTADMKRKASAAGVPVWAPWG
jgi:hypothetical protein